ncbi:MAG: hypothetical protein JXR48_11175 [Candidatus Delongbacteria bacterium]|nr:hypothetical protein [Candidatus Delongbacteria bacterium]
MKKNITIIGALFFMTITLSCENPTSTSLDIKNQAEEYKPPVGTPFLIKDLNVGIGDAHISDLTVFRNKLYFQGNDEHLYPYMWVFDGKNIQFVATNCSSPRSFIIWDNNLYFDSSYIEKGIWKYTGTGYPELIKEIEFTNDGVFYNNKIYLAQPDNNEDYELYSYDSINGLKLIKDIDSNNSSTPSDFIIYMDKIFFSASDETNGRELWSYDEINGTQLIKDIYTGSNDSAPGDFYIFNNELFFSAKDNSENISLWKYNQTDDVTQVLDNNDDIIIQPKSFCVVNDLLYFTGQTNRLTDTLWIYDGLNKPYIVADTDSHKIYKMDKLLNYRNQLVVMGHHFGLGAEIFKFDTENGFQVLCDITGEVKNSNPEDMIVYNNILCFVATDYIHGYELWGYCEE